MRMTRRWRVMAAGSILAGAGLSTGLVVSAGADPPGGHFGQAAPQWVIASNSQNFGMTGQGNLAIQNQTMASGDHLYSYNLGGRLMLRVLDRANCQGQSQGVARITHPSAGVWEISGVTAHGAQALDITLQNGTVVQPQLGGIDDTEYPFYDVQVSSPPVGFNTLGVPVPRGCPPPS